MKKTLFVVMFSIIILSCFSGCRNLLGNRTSPVSNSDSANYGEATIAATTNPSTDNLNSDSSNSTTSNSATKENKTSFDAAAVAKAIEVKGESYESTFSNYLILLLTNNSDFDCQIDVSIDLYNQNGEIVGTESETIEAFAKGTTVALTVMCDDKFAKYEYNIEASELKYYHCVDQNLACDVSTASKKAIISVTNNGNESAQFVQYTAIFYKDGTVVSHNWGYATDNDSEIKPGKTVKDEASCYEDFDSVKVYLHGRSEAHFTN